MATGQKFYNHRTVNQVLPYPVEHSPADPLGPTITVTVTRHNEIEYIFLDSSLSLNGNPHIDLQELTTNGGQPMKYESRGAHQKFPNFYTLIYQKRKKGEGTKKSRRNNELN